MQATLQSVSKSVFAARRKLSSKSGQDRCKVHEKAWDCNQNNRSYQAVSVQQSPQPPLPSSPQPNWAWTWHHYGSDCPLLNIRQTARVSQHTLSLINSEPEKKCSVENINFQGSGLRALVFVPSTIQHFFYLFLKLNKDSQIGEYCQALNKSQH